ncbi:hypothetical protein MWU49_08850 [Alcanivorax sp. S6407]|uniref:hypothetical protein n=1 Tax=Alcanivorax sp. S6407 TaxID=2926424 RepID=UPI001FF4C5D0|nr:hypothetical protein [Alcanivorax sp. S6407]MCK0153809.1 hypothetical protein [Alcanivorax sp. S6407]
MKPVNVAFAIVAGGACLPAMAADEDLERRLAEQDAKIEALSARLSEQKSVSPIDLSISGYINMAAAATNNIKDAAGNELSYRGTDKEVDYRSLSSAGLQITANVTDKLSGTVQLLAEGAEDYDVDAEWAYLAYDLTPALTVRGGRLVIPLYMHSQYYTVGYAYPWVSLPPEVYNLAPVRTMDGVDVSYRFDTGNISHLLNAYHGAVQANLGGLEFSMRDIVGINLGSNWGNLSTWLSYAGAEANLDLSSQFGGPTPYDVEGEYAYFNGIGFQYDNGSLLFMAERAEVTFTNSWGASNEAYYTTLGYRIAAVTPYVTWATVEDSGYDEVRDDPAAAFLYNTQATHQKSWTFGVRTDVADSLALKVEVSSYYDLGDASQAGAVIFPGPTTVPFQTGSLFSGQPDDDETPMVFRVAAQMVF